MAAFVHDTFTDTDGDELSTAHTGETGATWAKLAGGDGNHLVINTNRACRNNTTASVWVRYSASGTPPGADYYVECTVRPLTVAQYAAILGRIQSNGNHYDLWLTNAGLSLVRHVADSPTVLATGAFSWSAGTDYTVRFTISGTGATVTLTGAVNGSDVVTFGDTDAARYTSAGVVGLAGFDGSTSAGFVFGDITGDTAATDAITITTPVQYKVFQRSGSTGSIVITGTYTGTPTAIEASFNGGAYATIVASPAGGTFSGTLSGQTNGQGTLTVRFTNNTAINTTAADIGIGDVFVVAGDSISEGRGTNPQSYTHATLKAAKFTQADTWGEGNDGIDTGTSTGSHWPLVATQIMASQSVPVAFISCGTGSTDVAGSANTWATAGAEYAEMEAQVTASGVNAVKACLFHLGPNAVVNASTLSQATYNTAIDTLASDIAADIAGAPKLCIGIFGEVTTGSPPDRTSAMNNIRAAIIQAHGDNANVKPGPCLIDQDYSDGVHPQSDAALTAVAARWWAALSETFYSGSGGRGPRLSSATWNVARDTLTVVFDRTLKTGLTHATAAWIVSDNGTPMTISSIAYHGTNVAALVFTMSAAATGGAGTTTLSFASANDATGLVVPLSADISMPVGSAIQLPAEPILAAVVAEAFDAALTEASTAIETTAATIDALAALTEAATAAEAATATITALAALTEAATATDVCSATVTPAAAGTLTTEPLIRNNGTVAISSALNYLALYDRTTGALVLRATGLSTNGAGVATVTDAAIVAGTTYRVDWEETSGQRRMPLKAAA